MGDITPKKLDHVKDAIVEEALKICMCPTVHVRFSRGTVHIVVVVDTIRGRDVENRAEAIASLSSEIESIIFGWLDRDQKMFIHILPD